MKNNKKILSILLAGTILNGLVPYNVFANEEKLQEEQEKAVVEIVEDSKEKILHKKEDILEKSVKEEKREEEPKIKEEVQEDGPKIEEKLNFRKAQTRLAKFSNENNEIYLEEINLDINLLNEELKDKDYTVFIKKDNSYQMIDKDENGKYVLNADDVEHSYNINILKDGYR